MTIGSHRISQYRRGRAQSEQALLESESHTERGYFVHSIAFFGSPIELAMSNSEEH
jgi:hypothetical protein